MKQTVAQERVVWIDWMRVIACFMVMVVHSTEPFYLGGEGSLIMSACDAWWVAGIDSLVRCCVPLFLIASSFLQFPLHYSTGEFFKRRAVRVLVPFVIWSVFYTFFWNSPLVWGGEAAGMSGAAAALKALVLNFNYSSGHLWFVYMLFGLYLMMPMLSPWARKVSRRELGVYLGIWGFTTLIPVIRDWAYGQPEPLIFGPSGLPNRALFPLWGECSWNNYGTFYYISGMIGYLLMGLWFRKVGSGIGTRKSILIGAAGFVLSFAIVAGGFIRRVMLGTGGEFPFESGVIQAVWWETTWCFDSVGVALMTFSVIMMLKNITAQGWFYCHVILPISKASYGMYLGHMVALSLYAPLMRELIPATLAVPGSTSVISGTPLVILATAVCSYITVALAAIALQRIPRIGKYIIG